MKKMMLVLTALVMTTLVVHANGKQVKAQFTVTQVALDAANAKEEAENQIAKEEAAQKEMLEALAMETQTQGGTNEEK